MHRFKNILAVYGDQVGADDVLSQAVALARANGARLTLIDVLPEKYATSASLAERRKRLARLVPSIEAEGVGAIAVEVFVGPAFLKIIEQVLWAKHDLVVASADDGTTLRRFYFGSTATHLMRKCPCPVWIIRPNRPHRYANILACIDPKTNEGTGNELDEKILDLATSLAATNGAKLHIVHAWEVEGKDRDTVRSEVHDSVLRSILAKHEALHRDRVDRLLAGYSLAAIEHRIHIPRATPQQAILELVETHNIDLIVMGTVSRTGIAGLIIGNAAESILSVVDCGVFTVKPKGFVTPVVLDSTMDGTRLREAGRSTRLVR